ncbi:MAG TPA: MXAN_5187 C-terminal domain-containing protein, partial [Polyangiales bacterium]|nr:MXAN_5187 C-terminal domain-containing protein [Polyangiales bacterium]
EASEDEEGKLSVPPSEGHWKDAAFSDGQGKSAAASSVDPDEVVDDPALAAQLSAEGEDVYNDRVYREYVSAKEQLGENVASIPKDRFTQRLKGRADALVQKHGCRMVRFQVSTVDAQVVLRPVLIR